jgi:2,3-bisphosphoglycerate-independent phosphoglycerate mutase
MNPVPVIYVSGRPAYKVRDGRLADLAPTILFLLGMEKPGVMGGQNLLEKA